MPRTTEDMEPKFIPIVVGVLGCFTPKITQDWSFIESCFVKNNLVSCPDHFFLFVWGQRKKGLVDLQ